MPSKKLNLSAALREASGRRQPTPAAPPASTKAASSAATPSRRGKKIIAGHFDPAVSKQFKQLALDRGTSGQDLLAEALNDLFTKYQKNPIA